MSLGAGASVARLARWREAIVDVAAAALLPVVVFLVPFNAVVVANVRDLLYHSSLARLLLAVGLGVWAAGALILRRWGGRAIARLWVALPWAVLLLDVAGPIVARGGVELGTAVAADAVILLAVATVALASPWQAIRSIAAAAGVVLLVDGAVTHARFVQALEPELFVGPTVAESAPPPASTTLPGNVYHILLDAYHSEAFAQSVGDDAPRRYPGFTYYTRFNTNFPQTVSAEPALIHGRAPVPGLSIAEWPKTALRDGVWADLAASGVGVWLYPYGRWLCYEKAVTCLTSMDLERDAGATTTQDATVDLWALRTLPDSLERYLIGDQGGRQVRFSTTTAVRTLLDTGPSAPPRAAVVRELPTQHYNLRQFDQLLADEGRRPSRGQYVYWHGLIPHHDYIRDDTCRPVEEPVYDQPHYWGFVACANLMIERLAQRLRELGRFDDALIVVHADHGDPNFLAAPEWMGAPERALDPIARTYQPLDDTYRSGYADLILGGDSAKWRSFAVEMLSSGLLLVKAPGAATYSEDARPVQLLDLAPTILTHFGVEAKGYTGVPVSRVPADRERAFYAHSRSFDGKFSKYVLGPDGWRFTTDIPVGP